MSKLISIRNDLYAKLTANKTLSYSDTIDRMFDRIYTLEEERNSLQETTVTQEGRISKTLAGKTILYKVKEV